MVQNNAITYNGRLIGNCIYDLSIGAIFSDLE